MESITILRELWRLRYLVILAGLLALAIALMTAYRVSLAPPKLESRQYHVGLASARILIDTPDSQVVDLNPKGADALSSRASLLANLMASSPVKAIIARDAGVPASQLVAVAPSATGATAPTPLSQAASKSANVADVYLLTMQADETLPIIAIQAQAPDAEQAARLANAATSGLRDYLRSVAGAQNVPAARQVVISGLGAAQAADVVRGPRRLFAIIAFIFVFGLACFGLIMVSGIARGWRRAAELERSVAEATGPPDSDGTAAAAPSRRRRAMAGIGAAERAVSRERSASVATDDERLAG
jgi:hypothetical protein